jgi:diacylglycerol kinase (ATP)
MRWLAIVNPHSGRNRSQKRFARLLDLLKNSMAGCVITQYSGHATEIAQSAEEFDGLAVVGGDGTLFEVLRGMDVTRQQIAMLPAGTGNSFARDLCITTIAQGFHAIQPQNLIMGDLMQVTVTATTGSTQCWYASSTIGIGYPARSVQAGKQHFKPLGRWCYPLAATIETFRSQPFMARLTYDDNPVEMKRLTGMLINNTQHAGNFRAFPAAALNDGYIHVLEMQIGALKQTLHNLAVLTQTYFYLPAQPQRTVAINIELDRPQYLMVDGEIFVDVVSVDIQIAPHILHCYANGTRTDLTGFPKPVRS